jgi:hypothetical protein
VVQGRYDTLTELGETEYTMAQTDLPWDRYSMALFDGGHMLQPTAEALGAIRNFVSGPR